MSLETFPKVQAQEQEPELERRSAKRFLCCRKCLVRPESAPGVETWAGIVYNISTSGVGVVLPYPRGGVVAAILLGFGRAVGEAIAVTQVIGSAQGIHLSFFALGDTLASRIANQYQGALTKLSVSSLVYLAVILLVFALVVNVAAQTIVKRFEIAGARH